MTQLCVTFQRFQRGKNPLTDWHDIVLDQGISEMDIATQPDENKGRSSSSKWDMGQRNTILLMELLPSVPDMRKEK